MPSTRPRVTLHWTLAICIVVLLGSGPAWARCNGPALITTKASQALAAFLDVRDSLHAEAPVILLHNGMGTYEQLCEYWNPNQLFAGTTTEAAWQDENGRLIYAGRGKTWLGQPARATPPAWFGAWADADPDVGWSTDIALELWRKLLIKNTPTTLAAPEISSCKASSTGSRDATSNSPHRSCVSHNTPSNSSL